MEAIEVWTASYPEFEPFSLALKKLQSGIKSVGEPCPVAVAGQGKASVTADTAELQDYISSLEPEIQRLRGFQDVPPKSLISVHNQLQAETRFSHISTEHLRNGLKDLIGGEGGEFTLVPAATNDMLEVMIKDFVQEPLEEFLQRAHEITKQLEVNLRKERSIITSIRALSEQICEPGFRTDRVELMDNRSVQVQELLHALQCKDAISKGSETIAEKLKEKQHMFEVACDVNFKERRRYVSRHNAVVEELERKRALLMKYSEGLEAAAVEERKILTERQDQRARKVLRVSELLQQAFEGMLETIEECRSDNARYSSNIVEFQHGIQVANELKASIDEYQALHVAAVDRAEKFSSLEDNFVNWVQEFFANLQQEESQSSSELLATFSADKACMLSLSRIAVEHVRAQREQVARALESKALELTACQEAVSIMEFSKPAGDEIVTTLAKLQQVQECVKWQQQEVSALTAVEDRISKDANLVCELFGSDRNMAIPEDRWAQDVADADDWVTSFFYTWQKDLLGQLPSLMDQGHNVAWGLPSAQQKRSSLENGGEVVSPLLLNFDFKTVKGDALSSQQSSVPRNPWLEIPRMESDPTSVAVTSVCSTPSDPGSLRVKGAGRLHAGALTPTRQTATRQATTVLRFSSDGSIPHAVASSTSPAGQICQMRHGPSRQTSNMTQSFVTPRSSSVSGPVARSHGTPTSQHLVTRQSSAPSLNIDSTPTSALKSVHITPSGKSVGKGTAAVHARQVTVHGHPHKIANLTAARANTAVRQIARLG